MNQLVSIQCLRFLAASGVVLAHSASGKFLLGGFGVDIFFVISGFIITKVMTRRHWIDFVKDRFSRIYPIYWVCLVPVAIVGWDNDPLRALTSLTLWPFFGEFRTSYLGVAWTLCFEMLFYAAAALVLFRRWMLVIVLALYGVFLALGLMGTSPLFDFLGSTMVIEFLMGVGLAMLPATRFRGTGGLFIVVGSVAAVWGSDSSFGYVENMFNGEAAWRWAAWGVPGAIIVWGSMQFEGVLHSRIFKFGAAGGDASYAIYLTHPVFLLLAPANPYVLLALGPPALIALGFAVHYWIEKPLLRMMRALLASRKPQSTESDAAALALVDP